MTYPLISEYVEAVRNAEDNFDKLRNLRPVTDDKGNPVMTSGNFAVVFKMRDEKNDKLYAVKCFLKDQPNRAENYRMIAEELEFVSSSFLTKFQYLDNELFVDSANADGEEFPVLLMNPALDSKRQKPIGLSIWLIATPAAFNSSPKATSS